MGTNRRRDLCIRRSRRALRWVWIPAGIGVAAMIVLAIGGSERTWAAFGLYVPFNLLGSLLLTDWDMRDARELGSIPGWWPDAVRLSFIAQLPFGVLAAMLEGL